MRLSVKFTALYYSHRQTVNRLLHRDGEVEQTLFFNTNYYLFMTCQPLFNCASYFKQHNVGCSLREQTLALEVVQGHRNKDNYLLLQHCRLGRALLFIGNVQLSKGI